MISDTLGTHNEKSGFATLSDRLRPLKRWCTPWRLSALAIASLVLTPVIFVLLSFTRPQTEIWQHLFRTVLPGLLRNTFLLASGTVAATFVIGTSLAWLTAACRFPGRRFLSWALLLPMAVPSYVLAFVALGLFDFSSPLQSWLRTWAPAGFNRLPDIRSTAGVVSVMSLTLYPYVYLLARSAFLTQGQRALEAARSLGASPLKAFLKVVLPMARPWTAAGLSLVLMETLADFGAVSILNFDTFTTAIYKTWFGLFSLEAAAQLSALLVVAVFCVIAVEQRLRDRMRYTPVGRLDHPAPVVRLSGWRKWAAAGWAWSIFFVAFVLPMTQLAIWALPDLGEGFDARLFGIIGRTLTLAATATLVIVLFAIALSYARRRHSDRTMRLLARLATIGYAFPGTVLAVGVVIAVGSMDNMLLESIHKLTGLTASPYIQGSIATVIAAYAVRFMSVGANPVESALQRVSPGIDEAAAGMGVTGWHLLRRVHMPMIKNGIFTAAVLVCVDVMKEMPITLMTRPFGWDTLAVRIFEFTSEGEWRRAALPAVVLVVSGLAPIFLLTRASDNRIANR